jgi:hypothetical protein
MALATMKFALVFAGRTTVSTAAATLPGAFTPGGDTSIVSIEQPVFQNRGKVTLATDNDVTCALHKDKPEPAVCERAVFGEIQREYRAVINRLNTDSPRILGFKLSTELDDQGRQAWTSAVDTAVADVGKVRLLFRFGDFEGGDPFAVVDDFHSGMKHCSHIERIAMIGDREWEEWMGRLARPFTKALIRYFNAAKTEEAWAWLGEGL